MKVACRDFTVAVASLRVCEFATNPEFIWALVWCVAVTAAHIWLVFTGFSISY